MLAILHKVALTTQKHALTHCVCQCHSTLMWSLRVQTRPCSISYHIAIKNGYMGVCKMQRFSSLFRFSIERVSAYALIFFLPFEIESVEYK